MRSTQPTLKKCFKVRKECTSKLLLMQTFNALSEKYIHRVKFMAVYFQLVNGILKCGDSF